MIGPLGRGQSGCVCVCCVLAPVMSVGGSFVGRAKQARSCCLLWVVLWSPWSGARVMEFVCARRVAV